MARSPSFKRTTSSEELISGLRKPRILPETGWWKVGASEPREVPFEDSWENAAGVGNPPASWYLSEGGETRLRGKVTGGADNSVICTLPEEVRPEFVETFVCPIDENGNLDLSGIKFRAYQAGDLEV